MARLLKKYREAVAKEFAKCRIASVYLKTGDQCDYASAEQAGYGCFLRTHFLDILKNGEQAGIKNDIFADFTRHLREIEDSVRGYLTTTPHKWERPQWKGFFMALKERLGDGDWDNRGHGGGGSLTFRWHCLPDKYDSAGNRTRAADATGVYTTVYDALYRVTRVSNADAKRATYGYDAQSRRTKTVDPDGGRFTNVYDAVDRLTAEINPQGKRTSFAYDVAGRQVRQRHGNTAFATQIFDNAGQLTALLHATSAGALHKRFTYTYDNAGNRTAVHESDGTRTTWAYDASYQLKRERRSGANSFDVTHTYDAAGNRTVMIDSGVRTTRTFDAANQPLTERPAGGNPTTYAYDNSGNRTRKDALGSITDYVWDEDSRLVVVKPVGAPVTMTYNGPGKRVKREG